MTKVFYGIDESQIAENFNMDYSFKRNGVVFRTGNLAKADARPGRLGNAPTLTWTLRTYILNLDPNDGVLDTTEASLTNFDSPEFDLSRFGTSRTASRTGYGFAGWNTEADGSGEFVDLSGGAYALPHGSYEATLYAQWEAAGSELPKTGGSGTEAYMIIGAILIAAAGAGVIWYAIKKKDDDGGNDGGGDA